MPAAEPVSRAVRTWVKAHLPAGAPLIVACSGGADSLALAVATRQLIGTAADEGRHRLIGATVDHGLQAGSADRAATTAETLAGIGFPQVEVLTVTVDGPGGPEAAARRVRYRALRELAEHASIPGAPAAVLLAHTRDDQAETVLLGLARGSGPRSVAGMRPWRAPWGRPLLVVSRADTESACRSAGLQPWQDPHNTDPAFTRVRLRREVLPLLDEVLGGGVRPALARTALLMAQDLDALDQLAAAAAETAHTGDGALSVSALRAHPAAIRARVLRRWVLDGGAGPVDFDHLSRLDAAIAGRSGPSQVRIPGGFDVVRTGDELRLLRPVPAGSVPGAGTRPG